MSLLVLLILSNIHCIIVEAIYIPSLGVSKIDIKTLLNQNSASPRNLTKESYLNITELAGTYGYSVDEFKVTTEDGYILGLHRLRRNSSDVKGIPVFLMHGLLDSSDSWILQGPDTALGYLLTNEGFDVWLGNARGNKYSSAHIKWSPNQEVFWKFSWEEIGFYDLPAMIDFILMITHKENLYYVGHSQGTTSFFVMNSLKPEYTNKIKMMFALSPVAWLSHALSPMLKYLSTVPTTVLQYLQFFNTMTSTKDLFQQLYSSMCQVISTGCGSMFEMLFGTNYFVSDTMLPSIVEHATTSSVLQIIHFWQLYQTGRFCRFDYGWIKNLFIYGQFSPPDYDLSRINVPITLFFSSNDWLSHPFDVSILQSHLSNIYRNYYSQYFSHIDYLYASEAKDAVYENIIKDIHDYEGR